MGIRCLSENYGCGLVPPVGGIKEEILAAAAVGIKFVMLPARNRRDLNEVPISARQETEFVPLDVVEQASRVAIPKPDS